MDPSKPTTKQEQEDNFGNTADSSNQNQPIIIVDNAQGHVCIRIEGSHTTASDTDNESHGSKENKNVKFEDELHDVHEKASAETLHKEAGTTEEEKDGVTEEQSPDSDKIKNDASLVLKAKADQLERVKLRQQKTQKELQDIEQENKEISARFKQLMEMFDSFTKNLDSFEMPVIPSTSQDATLTWMSEKRPKSEILIRKNWMQPREHKSRFADYYSQKVMPDKIQKAKETDSKESQAETEKCTTSTATSHLELTPPTTEADKKPVQTLACQTSLDGHTSNYDLSSVAASCGTSRTDLQTSLNNYANADNACLGPLPPALANKKEYKENRGKSTTESPSSMELTSLRLLDETAPHPIHTIHIDTTTTPTPSEMRRRPLCRRFWSMICDCCSAVFLCLQVNRDCIFCLCFFVAFVVSASFLTAFFYRTLSMSSSLLQMSSQLPKTSEVPKHVRVADYPNVRQP